MIIQHRHSTHIAGDGCNHSRVCGQDGMKHAIQACHPTARPAAAMHPTGISTARLHMHAWVVQEGASCQAHHRADDAHEGLFSRTL